MDDKDDEVDAMADLTPDEVADFDSQVLPIRLVLAKVSTQSYRRKTTYFYH